MACQKEPVFRFPLVQMKRAPTGESIRRRFGVSITSEGMVVALAAPAGARSASSPGTGEFAARHETRESDQLFGEDPRDHIERALERRGWIALETVATTLQRHCQRRGRPPRHGPQTPPAAPPR